MNSLNLPFNINFFSEETPRGTIGGVAVLKGLFKEAFFVSNSKHTVPFVIRMIIGRGWGQGPMHSQILDSLFAQVPGLKVIMPTFPKDFKGMMLSAIRDKNPVIILEHRWLHNIKGKVDKKYYY